MSWTFEINPDSSLSTYSTLLDKDANTKGSFSEDYLSICRENKVVPCPYIKSISVNSTQECCKVSDSIIDISSWRAMLLALCVIGSKVVEIHVHAAQLTPQHILDLAKALEKMGNCPVVRLQYLYLLITLETTSSFVEAFKYLFSDSTCVEYLSLKGCRLTDDILRPAVSALGDNYKLRCLNLSGNELTALTVDDLFKSIKLRTNLNEICLSHNLVSHSCLSYLSQLFCGLEVTAEDEAVIKASTKLLADKNKAIKESNKKRKKAGYPEVAECSPSAEVVSTKDKKGTLVNRYFTMIDLTHNLLDRDSLSDFIAAVQVCPLTTSATAAGDKILLRVEDSSALVESGASAAAIVELDWLVVK